MIYRDATPSDGPAVDTMSRRSWIETFRHSCSPADLALYLAEAYGPEGALMRDFRDPAIHFHLAVEGDSVAGYAKLGDSYLHAGLAPPGTLQLMQIYVASGWHGKGVAHALMDWATASARDRGANALVLTVWEGNDRALAFYRRLGFAHIGDYAFKTGTQIDRDLVLRLTL
ncbi:GNAT family N-acetyltransferase [uncultured Sphingomonas sp.]|uniref:GNAT family N-acetyltransferase n=1 Tax=uncultured Sphingomonas sp. TaxID=158754 RepID=UPI0035CC660D